MWNFENKMRNFNIISIENLNNWNYSKLRLYIHVDQTDTITVLLRTLNVSLDTNNCWCCIIFKIRRPSSIVNHEEFILRGTCRPTLMTANELSYSLINVFRFALIVSFSIFVSNIVFVNGFNCQRPWNTAVCSDDLAMCYARLYLYIWNIFLYIKQKVPASFASQRKTKAKVGKLCILLGFEVHPNAKMWCMT